jgi:excisionase family DNA binding protein
MEDTAFVVGGVQLCGVFADTRIMPMGELATAGSKVPKPCKRLRTGRQDLGAHKRRGLPNPAPDRAGKRAKREWMISMEEAEDMEAHDDETLLTPSEVAAMFRVNPKTVTRWARAGKISAIRTLGGHRRFRASEIRNFLENVEETDHSN